MNRSLELSIRLLCIGWGCVMLLAGAAALLAPRARYVGSSPEPGRTLGTAPAVVTIRFSRELHPDSRIQVLSTVSVLPSGEEVHSGGQEVVTESGLDPNDPAHQSLRAALRPNLPGGLYRVDWQTVAAGTRAERFGSFYFGVTRPVPEFLRREMGRSVRERDSGEDAESSRAAAVVAGLLLIAFGIWRPGIRG
jgi:methionine-rich copper-binding protein CopC